MAVVSIRTELPSGASNVGSGARDIRANKQAVATGLAVATNFPNKSEPLKPGWGRAFSDIHSRMSYGNANAWRDEGKLYFNTTKELLTFLHRRKSPGGVNYDNVTVVGAKAFIEHNSDPQGFVWYSYSSEMRVTGTGNRTIEFTHVGTYEAPPHVMLTSHETNISVALVDVQNASMRINGFSQGGASSAYTLSWFVSGRTSGIKL